MWAALWETRCQSEQLNTFIVLTVAIVPTNRFTITLQVSQHQVTDLHWYVVT